MADKTVLLGVITELGTNLADGYLKRDNLNANWEQVVDLTLALSGNRTIKIRDNDNARSLTIKTGDAVTTDTNSGDLNLDVGAKSGSGVYGKVNIGAVAAEVNLGKSGGKIGFFAATAVVRASAYTQTYSTADREHDALTSATLTDSSGGTPGSTLAAITGGGSDCENATKNAIASLAAQVNALRVDLENAKQLINSLIDDAQAYGLAT